MEEVKFTEEQLEYVKKVLNEELEPLKKDVQENYVPKIVIKNLLNYAKKLKKETNELYMMKHTYVDGMIFAFEELLENNWEKE